jgi:hypothetical protein
VPHDGRLAGLVRDGRRSIGHSPPVDVAEGVEEQLLVVPEARVPRRPGSRWSGHCLSHGVGTVVKELADLTASGVLVNPRDKSGYRLPTWHRVHPNLFN